MLLQKFANSRIEEVQLPQNVCHIKLVADLLTGLDKTLGRFPILAPSAQIKKGFDRHKHEVEEIERP